MSGPVSSPEWAIPSPRTLKQTENELIRAWDPFIEREALKVARGNRAVAKEWSQEARIRLVLTARGLPKAPPAYLRKVVKSAIMDSCRGEMREWCNRRDKAENFYRDIVLPGSTRPSEVVLSAAEAWTMDLPLTLRTIYENIYVQERTQRETASILRMSQPRVAQYHRQLLQTGQMDLEILSA